MTTISDWCERLDDAISEGRFLEDPALWRHHVLACGTCKKKAESVFRVQDYFEGLATKARVVDPVPEESFRVINEVFARYARRQARLRWGVGGIAAIVLALGAVFMLSRSPPRDDRDPYSVARELRAEVFPPGQPPRYELLRSVPALQAKYFEALEDPRSVVRRTALHVLMSSGIELPPERLESILLTWKEDLAAPLLVAGVGGAEQHRQDLQGAGADSTAFVLFHGAKVQVARGGQPLRYEVVEPFLRYVDPKVRAAAIGMLRWDPSYRPDALLESIVASDPSVDVRQRAADCLMVRGGEPGIRTAVGMYRAKPDPEVEKTVAGLLTRVLEGRELARDRMRDPATAPMPWVSYGLGLVRKGDPDVPTERLEAIVAAAEAEALTNLAFLADLAGWTWIRAPLQERWRGLPPSFLRTSFGSLLVRWDLAHGTPEDLRSALEICRDDPDDRFLDHLRKLAESETPDVRTEATRLLQDRSKK